MPIGGGLTDSWSIIHALDLGFTWPLSDESPAVLLSPTKETGFDSFAWSGANNRHGLGEDVDVDLTSLGFRPSDHAGVSATVVLEP